MALLEVDRLSTRLVLADRTIYAVDDVSFSIEAGQTLGLVGESGSGKTMTGSSIMRLLPPAGRITSGSVRLEGQDLLRLPERKMRQIRGRDIGMIFQDPMNSLNPTRTIGRQIAEPIIIHQQAKRLDVRARTLELLELAGMPRPVERIDSYPHQLSGGLRQRAAIAMALACSPKLLIADEPTTALDASIQDQILRLIERLKRELGMAILLVTHDLGIIAAHADRVLVMYAGRIVEQADTATLFAQPRHRYTQALLESLPRIDRDPAATLYSIPGSPPELSALTQQCRFAPRCQLATEECRLELPAMTHEEPGHSFACVHPRIDTGPALATGGSPSHGIASRTNNRSADVLLRLDDVIKEFPVRSRLTGRQGRAGGSIKAVSGVTLDVYRGETLGLVGESGCGKTTIGRMMVALEIPDSGSIQFGDEDVFRLRGRRLRRRRRDLQMIFQDPYASLDPRMRVEATVAEPLAIQATDRGRRRDRVLELLADVGLAESAARLFPREFSGGQRQRIGIARALALTPDLIVADEPVSALDISIRSQLLNLLRRLQAEHELTYVMISHDLSVVRYLADRVAVMYLGRLVEIGPTASVYDNTVHPYTAALIQAIPVPDPTRSRQRDRIAVRGELPSAVNPPAGCRFHTRCQRAEDICEREQPPLRPFGDNGHLAACHLPLRAPSLIQPGVAPDA
ncbi:MAG: oligopeptide/dipeptide transporter, ATPase subunit [Frankiales bacterium]|nr:oligopeptide/dipeptide transporter, ATPase subunit [Frankiales bacterium]